MRPSERREHWWFIRLAGLILVVLWVWWFLAGREQFWLIALSIPSIGLGISIISSLVALMRDR